MINIELDILWHTDHSYELQKLGINTDPNWDECAIRKTTFLVINGFCQAETDVEKEEYCYIYSNGSTYVCRHSYTKLQELINKNLNS